jgi:hypothetical protein
MIQDSPAINARRGAAAICPPLFDPPPSGPSWIVFGIVGVAAESM